MSDDQLGKETNYGFDQDGRERREMCMAIAECPVCGKDVLLIADTEEWTEDDQVPGRWRHNTYGPAQGVCCDRLIVDSWYGCFVYDLRGSGP